jgi:hypothetical protein
MPQVVHGRFGAIISGLHAGALAQGLVQRHRSAMLLEEIAEGFVGDVLQALAGFKTQLIERVPGLGVEFDAAADGWLLHGAAVSSCITAKSETVDGSATGREV